MPLVSRRRTTYSVASHFSVILSLFPLVILSERSESKDLIHHMIRMLNDERVLRLYFDQPE